MLARVGTVSSTCLPLYWKPPYSTAENRMGKMQLKPDGTDTQSLSKSDLEIDANAVKCDLLNIQWQSQHNFLPTS